MGMDEQFARLGLQAFTFVGLFLAGVGLLMVLSGPGASPSNVGALPPSVRENPASYRPVARSRPVYSDGSSGYSGGGGYSGGK